MTKARDLASSGLTLTATTTTADAALAKAGGTMTGNLAMGTNLVDGVDVSARDAVLTDTTTKATAALPKSGGAMTGAITTNSTFDGVDIATRDGVLSSTVSTATNALNNANNALPKEGGAMTGAITTNSTFDGVDVGARNSVLTSTTTTANAALPKAGGALTGVLTTISRVGVGTASPTKSLHVVDASDSTILVDAASGNQATVGFAEAGTFKFNLAHVASGDYFQIFNHYNDTVALSVKSNSNVGVGTTTPVTRIHSTSSQEQLTLSEGNARGATFDYRSSTGNLNISTNGANARSSPQLILDLNGNLLVGKTAESGNTAGHFLSASGYSRATRNGSVSLMNRLSSDGSIIDFQKDGSAIGSLGVLSGNNLTISGAVADHGGLQFGTHAVLPMEANADSNGTINLGGSGSRFKDAYLSGGVFLGGTGTANKISDYETGSFSPTYTWATPGNSSVGYSTRAGYYVKVGNLVHFELYFRMNGVTKGNASGSPTVSGLPFTAFNSGGYNLAAVNLVLYNHNFSTTPYAYVGSNSTNIGLERQVSGAATSPLEDASTYSFIWVTGSYRATT